MNWFSSDSWIVLNLHSYWQFEAQCSILFYVLDLFYWLALNTSSPSALYGRERILVDYIWFKFHHFKIAYFQPEVGSVCLGNWNYDLPLLHDKLTMSEQWMLWGKSNSLGSGPCLLLQRVPVYVSSYLPGCCVLDVLARRCRVRGCQLAISSANCFCLLRTPQETLMQ